MANEKHDPWALLREARGRIGLVCDCGEAACERTADFVRRIDVALAGRDKPVEELNAEQRIWRAYRNRELTEDEARERLAALKAEDKA
jgi:chemotaxis regulatin CheY-phosphate phosphatase CheZ